MSEQANHHWRFFSIGGFEQVLLDKPEDLAKLRHLDQKLWASLACPTDGLEFDARLLSYIDQNKDGRIRAPEILSTIDWVLERLANQHLLFEKSAVTLADFAKNEEGEKLAATAKRLLAVLGRAENEGLSADDTDDLSVLFPAELPNGDGLIHPTLTNDEALKATINDIIACMGAETDRSGEDAISADTINAFFEQVQQVSAWQSQSQAANLAALTEETADAAASLQALREKIDDYFTRVELVAFDERAAQLINGEEAELIRLSALSLADTTELKPLPLAKVSAEAQLPLTKGLNPAWSQAVAAFRQAVVAPLLGEIETLSKEQWTQLKTAFDSYFAWLSSKPEAAILAHLSVDRIVELAGTTAQEQLLELVKQDEAVAEEANGLLDLDKLLRCQRDLLQLLKNFLSFQDFYQQERKAIFQAGTLYIDGKSCDLTVEVKDVDAHAAVATNSNNYLLYCTCTRRGQPVKNKETMNIVAAITAGSEGGLVVGRNGLFYDRQGNDWDATVVKVLTNPISIREAFWTPYRRIATFISEKIQDFAASRDSEVVSKATSTVNEGADSEAASAFDIGKFAGIFAAIGLAMAALGTALASLMGGLRALEWWQWPLVFIGVILMISGPSMLMAWFKLRRRNLGPILDANGWAVNTKAGIDIPFGTRLTQLAHLPSGSERIFMDEKSKGRVMILLGVLVVVGVVAAALTYINGMWSI